MSTTLLPVDTTLLVLGDWGSGTAPQGAVAGSMARYAENEDIHAILTTGDNFYSNNAGFLMQPFDWAVTGNVPFWITWGNDDIESESRIRAINDAFETPPRWARHRWGPIDVVVLDSNQVHNQDQIEFLTNTLDSSDQPTILALHHPVYSCGESERAKEIVNRWIPRFDEDVFLVVSGHDHNYQRFEDSGITFIVTGGGGQQLHEVGDCPPGHPDLIAGDTLHHFLAIAQTNTTVLLEAVDVNGNIIDRVAIPLPWR